jgi:hypothetical protein
MDVSLYLVVNHSAAALRVSNINNYKYDWIWKKSNVMGFLNAKKDH